MTRPAHYGFFNDSLNSSDKMTLRRTILRILITFKKKISECWINFLI